MLFFFRLYSLSLPICYLSASVTLNLYLTFLTLLTHYLCAVSMFCSKYFSKRRYPSKNNDTNHCFMILTISRLIYIYINTHTYACVCIYIIYQKYIQYLRWSKWKLKIFSIIGNRCGQKQSGLVYKGFWVYNIYFSIQRISIYSWRISVWWCFK